MSFLTVHGIELKLAKPRRKTPAKMRPFDTHFLSVKSKLATWGVALLTLATFDAHHSTALAQGTAFTYQGRLNVVTGPADGSFDLLFTLFATNSSGAAIAGPVTNAAVAVSNGLFTTTVDFGNVFTGTSNWLEIAVSPNGANAFTKLAPRQQLT